MGKGNGGILAHGLYQGVIDWVLIFLGFVGSRLIWL